MSIHPATAGTYADEARNDTVLIGGAKYGQAIRAGTGVRQRAFNYTPLPAGLAGRQVLSAVLEVTMFPGTGADRTTTIQRHGPTASGYAWLKWSNQPTVLAGSTPVSVTQDPAVVLRTFDVLADLQAIVNGAPYYGWMLTTTYATEMWKLHSYASGSPVRLVVELADAPVTPTDVGPHGITSMAAPVVTWQTPLGLVSAQVQVAAEGAAWTAAGGFTTPTFDSGTVTTTIGQIDLDDEGYTGITEDTSVDVTVRQSTVLGTSAWSAPITITRDTLAALAISSPGVGTTDPTPTVVWALTGQTRWQVITRLGGAVIHNTGVQPGADTGYQPPKGATKTGQTLSYEVRGWTTTERAPSPGDPGYSVDTTTTLYAPGAVAAVDTITADQVGYAPWVDVTVTRAAGLPDEWLLVRGGEIIARTPALVEGDPVWTIRDWTAPPNTDLTYEVLPVEGTTAGASAGAVPIRTKVTGAWLFDPDTGVYVRCRGTDLQVEHTENVAWYEPTGAAAPIKRTFALRGLEGTIAGKLEDLTARTLEEHLDDWWAIKSNPSRAYRVAYDTINIPVLVAAMKTTPHQALTTYKAPTKVVSFEIRQNGELPFEPVTL